MRNITSVSAIVIGTLIVHAGCVVDADESETMEDATSNPSFESSLTGWMGWQASLTRVALSGAPNGSYVVKVSRSTGTSFAIDDSPNSIAHCAQALAIARCRTARGP